MKAILINPEQRTVEEVAYSGDWRDITSFLDCNLSASCGMELVGDSVFVDDEGLFADHVYTFSIPSMYPQPMAGKGLIIGSNEDGEAVSCKLDVNDVLDEIRFHGEEMY